VRAWQQMERELEVVAGERPGGRADQAECADAGVVRMNPAQRERWGAVQHLQHAAGCDDRLAPPDHVMPITSCRIASCLRSCC